MSKEIQELIAGYQQFRHHYFHDVKNNTFDRLVRLGQQPKALVIACCDSRVDPSIVMNCEPGDLFVIRNVANLVPPYESGAGYHGTSAAIEFAVQQLELRDIIIIGHSHCGGIRSLIQNVELSQESFVNKWMELAQSARQEVLSNHPHDSLDDQANLCGLYAIVHSLDNLMTFPWIAEKVSKGDLSLHGWYLTLLDGLIHRYNPESACFELLS